MHMIVHVYTFISFSCASVLYTYSPCMYNVYVYVHVYVHIQVNKKFCELKGGRNIGIVEKAQETRFGMSPKYSSYIGIAS